MLSFTSQVFEDSKIFKVIYCYISMEFGGFTVFFKKKIEPFIALAVLILLIILAFQIIKGNELREEISENCGWGEEDYRCFCKKSEALFILSEMEGRPELGEFKDVSMDR